MTIAHFLSAGRALLLLIVLGSGPAILRGAEPIRLAIGPFFAPAGNDSLRQAALILPELLVADLSGASRFQLVERTKVQSVWSEMNLSAAGLVARDNVARLGQVLACDWLVSGSFVQVGGRTQVWTKVIDVRSGVVLDLDAAPYDSGGFTNTVAGIAAFLDKAGSQPKGRQFIAMGPFVDMNPTLDPKREDWSKRIATLIEAHFLKAGYGVVEIAAVGPIFEERRLETAGLTGQPEGRVKLQAAFWLIDGGCEWVAGAPDKLGVGLRIQKIGGPAQMFRVTESAGEETEKGVLATITRALASTNLVSQPTVDAEADLLAARGMELASRSSPFRAGVSKTPTQWDSYKQQREQGKRLSDNREAALATYERTLLRSPGNLEAKTMLGYALLADRDSAKRARGKELLGEVVASKDTNFVGRAQEKLKYADAMARIAAQDAHPPRRPDDWASVNRAFAENPSDLEARFDLGAVLLKMLRATDRERGKKLLAEVSAGDRQDLAERARKLLAEPEASPAITPAVIPAAETADQSENRRREFLQKQFASFMAARFQKDGESDALVQRLRVKEKAAEFKSCFYSGFKFTAPEWLDGDLQWMFLLAKTEAEKDFNARGMFWYIIPASGTMEGFTDSDTVDLQTHPQLAKRFPFTSQMTVQKLPMRHLKPGQEYAIWFAFRTNAPPDIAFALTIQSERGAREFGVLPLH